MPVSIDPAVQKVLQRGVVIPAHPLALTAARKLDFVAEHLDEWLDG